MRAPVRGAVAVVVGASLWLAGCLVADPPPRNVTAEAGNGQATVSWERPLGDKGATVAAYKVTPRAGGAEQAPILFPSAATTQVVTGLTNGVTYTFQVTAIQADGRDGARSVASNAVTPEAPVLAGLDGDVGHTCARFDDGSARCWGENFYGQLGNGTLVDASTPVAVTGLDDATAVATGGDHTCALREDGTVACWGTSLSFIQTPQPVGGIADATAIAAGYRHRCAVLGGGAARCWGANARGQLGNGTTTTSQAPVIVAGLTNAMAISAGHEHTCALLADGTARCWGANTDGQLGNGTTTSSSVPVTVAGLSDAVAISVGDVHSCALLEDGTARCWGGNAEGQLGNGAGGSGQDSSTPVVVTGLTAVAGVSVGFFFSCAVLEDGTVRCWGANDRGQLGNGTTTPSAVPVTVTGLTSATAVAAGGAHACAALAGGVARCWGWNHIGQLGNGQSGIGQDSSTPVNVVGIP